MKVLSEMSPEARIAELSPMSLEELNDTASLQTRADRKYILGATELTAMLDGLTHRLAALDIDRQRSFGYESVYFDTPGLECYRSAAHRRRRRFKVRTRTYLDTQTTMLEVKTRGPRNLTVKKRQTHTYDARTSLDGHARSFVDTIIGRNGLASTLVPVLTTTYERVTLVDLDDVARLTIDRDLRCTRGCRSISLGHLFIVETKSSGSPSATDRWLWERGLRPEKISKFGTGLAALDPALRANKWHRTMQRYFRPDTSSTGDDQAPPTLESSGL